MARFRKKPIVIEATQWFEHGDHPAVEKKDRADDVLCIKCCRHMIFHGSVETLEGEMRVCPGDWIITGVNGEIYPCKPDIFEKTYQQID